MFGTTCWSVLASKSFLFIIQIEGFKKEKKSVTKLSVK